MTTVARRSGNSVLTSLRSWLRRQEVRDKLLYATFLAIPLGLILLFSIVPILTIVRISFTDMLRFTDEGRWVGLRNYEWVLTNPLFRDSIFRTAKYTVGLTVGKQGLSLILAVLLSRKKLRFGAMLQTIMLFTYVMPGVVVGNIWRLLLDGNIGLLDHALKSIGVKSVFFLGDPRIALYTIIGVAVWRSVPFTTLIYTAAMQTINPEWLEAAEIDGASEFRRFWHITLPALMPSVASLVMLDLIGAPQEFFLPVVLTAGGPARASTLWSLDIWANAFAGGGVVQGATGGTYIARAAALSVVVFLIVFVIGAIYYRFFRRASEWEA